MDESRQDTSLIMKVIDAKFGGVIPKDVQEEFQERLIVK